MLRMEGFVLAMVPSKLERYAAMKDVQILFKRQEFAGLMVPRRRLAVMKVVTIKFKSQEYALGMVPRRRLAAMYN